MKLEEYLIEQGAKLQEKIEQLRSENKAEESNKCTFQPSISRKSTFITFLSFIFRS